MTQTTAHTGTTAAGHGHGHGDGTGDTAVRTATHHHATPVTRARTVGRFLAHLAEMVVVMVLGMLLLGPAWDWAGAALGVEAALGRPDVGAVVMLLDMVAAMTVWMRLRRHSWRAIWEMNAAMAVPFVVLLTLFRAGAATAGDVMLWGHVLMVLAMAAAMLLRPAEYTQHVHGFDLAWLRRRWPVLLGLTLLA
ncbi:hypothetical protein, partial [Promicromonospora kroppenstedtii]|uniref:hypothetical protein n=1 Tax=Promicromonospora kroppenstedtii TaxID=440482 RepID=UPI001B7F9FBA